MVEIEGQKKGAELNDDGSGDEEREGWGTLQECIPERVYAVEGEDILWESAKRRRREE